MLCPDSPYVSLDRLWVIGFAEGNSQPPERPETTVVTRHTAAERSHNSRRSGDSPRETALLGVENWEGETELEVVRIGDHCCMVSAPV